MEHKCLNCVFFKAKSNSKNRTAHYAGECLKNTFLVINSRTGKNVYRKLSIYHYHLCASWEVKSDKVLKGCTYCGQPKNEEEFFILSHGSRAAVCKECNLKATKHRKEMEPEKYKLIHRTASKKHSQKKKILLNQ